MRQYDVEIKIHLTVRVAGENEDIAKDKALDEIERQLDQIDHPIVGRAVSVENIDDYYGE